MDRLQLCIDALESISKNTCCDTCQEAKKVALKALGSIQETKGDKSWKSPGTGDGTEVTSKSGGNDG